MTRHHPHQAQATSLRGLAGWLRPSRGKRTSRGDRTSRGERHVVLRDGSGVLVRQVRSTDTLLLADGFARLSERSRRMRFLGKKDELTAAELRYYTDVDHHDHEALVALDPASGRGVGVARYVRDAEDKQAAEIALTIADDWQSRGLGTELLARLSHRGRQESICRFTGVVSVDNVPMGMLLCSVGAVETHRSLGTVEYDIALVRTEEYSLDWWFRCVDDGSVFTWQ
jgi:GNAT superfamily N-acetyltransferase